MAETADEEDELLEELPDVFELFEQGDVSLVLLLFPPEPLVFD